MKKEQNIYQTFYVDKKQKVPWIEEKEKYLESNIWWELYEVRSDWKKNIGNWAIT